MGVNYYTYVGPYIKLTGKLNITHTDNICKCPACDAVRSGKFCSECGSQTIIVQKQRVEEISSVNSLAYHIGEQEDLEIDDMFALYEYTSGCLIPNRSSKYSKIFERSDDVDFDIHDIVDKINDEIYDFTANVAEFINALHIFKIDHKVCYGVVSIAS